MIETDSIFKIYANEFIRDVPGDHVRHLVALFMEEASINMGADVKDETIERTIYHIQKDFSYIPVNFIAYAFTRGSLGKMGKEGAGRLVPKTIHYWLSEITVDYNEQQAKAKLKASLNDVSIAMNLEKYPAGKAICTKIDWYKKGLINGDDWDKISLKQLAEMIGAGHYPVPQEFGIKI